MTLTQRAISAVLVSAVRKKKRCKEGNFNKDLTGIALTLSLERSYVRSVRSVLQECRQVQKKKVLVDDADKRIPPTGEGEEFCGRPGSLARSIGLSRRSSSSKRVHLPLAKNDVCCFASPLELHGGPTESLKPERTHARTHARTHVNARKRRKGVRSYVGAFSGKLSSSHYSSGSVYSIWFVQNHQPDPYLFRVLWLLTSLSPRCYTSPTKSPVLYTLSRSFLQAGPPCRYFPFPSFFPPRSS